MQCEQAAEQLLRRIVRHPSVAARVAERFNLVKLGGWEAREVADVRWEALTVRPLALGEDLDGALRERKE